MDKLTDKVKRTIKEYHMLNEGGRVIAAVSGGADSVCLLCLLKEMAEEFGLSLRAVHVHHGLRGEEADRDARFTEELCKKQGIFCQILYADVRKMASEQGMSEEEAGRILRYELLEREAENWEQEEEGAPVKIATAHHKGDQAETILHNLFRGSGIGGLKGIPYVRGRMIRPLLEADRQEITSFLEQRGIPWVWDSTNGTDHYTRNRIRFQVLPLIEKTVNPAAVSHIVQFGKLAGMADDYLSEQAKRWLDDFGICHMEQEKPVSFECSVEEFLKQPVVLQNYITLHMIKELTGSARDIGLAHIEQAGYLCSRPGCKRADLPYGISIRKEYDRLVVESGKASKENQGEENPLPQVEIQVFPYKKGEVFPKNRYTKWFDCDKIKGTPVLRTRRSGDYLMLEDGKKKLLKRFFIDEKIPRQMREKIWLLADGDHVMWVIGYRMSGYYKIGPETKNVLQADVKGAFGVPEV